MVTLLTTTQELLAARNSELNPIGFVPTMGNLHAGHISLLEEALKEFDVVYFSIFINPTQFGPNEDFNRYPRTLEADIELIKNCLKKFSNKKVILFSPQDPKEIYGGIESRVISVEELKDILEGAIRPGHFDGVATVVYRLFELIRPSMAYFGLKDYQQYLVIKKMVKDLNIPVSIKGMPIVRETTGLALSSRNQYLSQDQKDKSLVLFQSLNRIQKILNGKRDNLNKALEVIDSLKADPQWNYLELRDAETLHSDVSKSSHLVLLGVYQLGTTRLLDNLQVEIE